MDKSIAFRSIKLTETNKIVRKGYYNGEITDTDVQIQDGRHDLRLEFRIVKGKCEGFLLSAVLKDIYRRKARLSHLCNAVGITEELNNPGQLLGKIVKLRVIPYYRTYMGKRYLNHKITRFHPAD